jgi:hypothetical protein
LHRSSSFSRFVTVPLDRKAISREYKNTPRPMGVGAIRNTGNGKLLLVAGRDINALLNRHRAQLRLGMHRNAALQQDWNAAGEGAFVFEVVDTLPPRETSDADPTDDLRALQELWLEKLAPFPPAGYNLST